MSGLADAAQRLGKIVAAKQRDDAKLAAILADVLVTLPVASEAGEIKKKMQTQLEKLMLGKVLHKTGHSMHLREMAGLCIVKLFEADSDHLMTAYDTCMSFIGGKDPVKALAALDAFGRLSVRFGQQFLVSVSDALSALARIVKGTAEVSVKEAALRCCARMYEGTGGPMPGEPAGEVAVKMLLRGMTDRFSRLRTASMAAALEVVASSTTGRELDLLVPQLHKGAADPDVFVRHETAVTLGAVLAVACQTDYTAANESLKKKKKKMRFDVSAKHHVNVPDINAALALLRERFAKTGNPMVRASVSASLQRLLLDTRAARSEEETGAVATQVLQFLAPGGKHDASAEDGRQAARCVAHALQHGLLDGQGEKALESAATAFVDMVVQAQQLGNPKQVTKHQASVCLRMLSCVFVALGPALAALPVKSSASEVLVHLLSDDCADTRIQAAQCFRQMARAAPSGIANWLSVLHKIVIMQLQEMQASPEEFDQALFFSLHGHIHALVAVVGMIPETAHGVPLQLCDSLFDVCQQLFALPNGGPSSATYEELSVVRVSGWLLLGALLGLGAEWLGFRLNPLFAMWKEVLGKKSKLSGRSEKELTQELALRTQALYALRAFVHVFRHRMTTGDNGQPSAVLRPTLIFLRNSFSLLKALDADSSSPATPLRKAAVQRLRAVLLDVFEALPPQTYAACFVPLLHMTVAAFTKTSARTAELQRMLDQSEAPLGPVTHTQPHILAFSELAEREHAVQTDYPVDWLMRTQPHSERVEQGGGQGDSGSNSKTPRPPGSSSEPFPPLNGRDRFLLYSREATSRPALRAADAAVRVFASIFLAQAPQHQQQLLQHFRALVDKQQQVNKLDCPAALNLAAAVLGVCSSIQRSNRPLSANPQALDAVLHICLTLTASPAPDARRAAAESLALVALSEPQTFAQSLLTQLKERMESKERVAVAGAVLSLGCVHRALARRAARYLNFTVSAVQSLSRDFSEPYRLWLLHSLWLAVSSSHPDDLLPCLPAVLALLDMHALKDKGQRSPSVAQALARVLRGCLECILRHLPAASRPNEAVTAMLQLWQTLQRSHPDSCVQTECVHVLQLLVLHGGGGQGKPSSASTAACAETHFPWLEAGLRSPDPQLRTASLGCCLRWALRQPLLVRERGLVNMLLRALDSEASHELRRRLRSAVVELVVATGQRGNKRRRHSRAAAAAAATAGDTDDGAGMGEETWQLLSVFKRAVMGGMRLPSDTQREREMQEAAMARAAGQDDAERGVGAGSGEDADDDDRDNDDDDDDEEEDDGGIYARREAEEAAKHAHELRQSTKAFSLQCVQTLVSMVREGGDARQLDPAYARACRGKANRPRLLVSQLADLCQVSCIAANSVDEPLRLAGITLLKQLLQLFQHARDPDGHNGELLLELYQAQCTAVLRGALRYRANEITSPAIRAAACSTASLFLGVGCSGEATVVTSVLSLLLAPVNEPADMLQWVSQFDGRVRAMILIAHLSAVAALHFKVLVQQRRQQQDASGGARGGEEGAGQESAKQRALGLIGNELKTQEVQLARAYCRVVRDCALVSTLSRRELNNTSGYLFEGAQSTNIRHVYSRDAGLFTRAAARLLSKVPLDEDADDDAGDDDKVVGGESSVTRAKGAALVLGVCAQSLRGALDRRAQGQPGARDDRVIANGLDTLSALCSQRCALAVLGDEALQDIIILLASALRPNGATTRVRGGGGGQAGSSSSSSSSKENESCEARAGKVLYGLFEALLPPPLPPQRTKAKKSKKKKRANSKQEAPKVLQVRVGAAVLHRLFELLAVTVHEALPRTQRPGEVLLTELPVDQQDQTGVGGLGLGVALGMVPALCAVPAQALTSDPVAAAAAAATAQSDNSDNSEPQHPGGGQRYIPAALGLCVQAMRCGGERACSHALDALRALLALGAVAGSDSGAAAGAADSIAAALNGLPPSAPQPENKPALPYAGRVRALLHALLLCALARPFQDNPFQGTTLAADVVCGFLRGPSQAGLRGCALSAIEAVLPLMLAASQTGANAAPRYLLGKFLPHLMLLCHHGDETGAVPVLLGALEAVSDEDCAKLLALALPPLVIRVQDKDVLPRLLALAARCGAAFKQAVARLNPQLQAALQAAVQERAQRQQKQAAEAEHKLNGTRKGSKEHKKERKKKKKKKDKKKPKKERSTATAVEAVTLKEF